MHAANAGLLVFFHQGLPEQIAISALSGRVDRVRLQNHILAKARNAGLCFSSRTRLCYGAPQPGKRKLAMRVCQPAVLVAWPAAV